MQDTIVDLWKTDEFTEEHLETTRQIYKDHWKTFYPELFGDKLPKEIKFVGFDLLPMKAQTTAQVNRAGGRTSNVKYDQIKQNIERNGFKLKHPPIAWFRWNDTPTGYVSITGDTRTEIAAHYPFEMKNLIVAIYERNPGYTDSQVQDAIDSCGLRFNTIHDPAAPISPEDVKHTVSNMIQRYLDTNGEAGIKSEFSAISDRVEYVCGNGIFQPQTKLNIIYEIYNNFNPNSVVISWSTAKKSKYRVDSFLKRNNFVNTDKVIYHAVGCSRPSRAFTQACKIAAENPKAEIRIVLHTATLNGNDLCDTYRKRIQKFISDFMVNNHNISKAADGNDEVKFSRIKIYAALPALASVHDIEKPFFLNEKTGKFYQKGNDDYVFDMLEDDDVFDEMILDNIDYYEKVA